MTTQHTPGPWYVHQGDDYLQIQAGRAGHAITGPQMYPDKRDAANAHLIAAAPDLRAFAAAVKLARETPGTPSDFEMRITLAWADLDQAQPELFK